MRIRIPTKQALKKHEAKLSTLKSYGDDVLELPEDGWTRIAFQNANGIQRQPDPAEDMITAAKEYAIDIFGIAEPNYAFDDRSKAIINSKVKKDFGCGLVTYGSTANHGGYHPGGILQLANGQVVGHHTKNGVDRMGRYTWMTFEGKARKVSIITAYRVGQERGTTPTSGDSNTAYWQQVQQLIREGGERPDPRNLILDDLTKMIQQQINAGCEVILMMDANDTNERGTKLHEFSERLGLHDVVASRMNVKPKTSRMGSTHIIDYILATEGIVEYVTKAGFCAAHEGLQSDHVMLWADINLRSFLGEKTKVISTPQAREFNCANTKMRDEFTKELKRIHKRSRLAERVRALEREFQLLGPNPYRMRKYNSIDRELIDSMKAAAKKVVKKKQFGYHRSPALAEAGIKVLFWKAALTATRQEIPMSDRLYELAARAGVDVGEEATHGWNVRTLQQHVREAWQGLKQCQKHAVELRAKWLESVARYKATAEDDEEAAKILRQMVTALHQREMHKVLTSIFKGE